jgi:phosphoribosylformylglycinamidine synthase
VLHDEHFGNDPIDMPIGVLLGKPPKMRRDVRRLRHAPPALDLTATAPADALHRVLRLPAVANKTFLVTIADRSITGLVARDQMVGPYQTPLSDVAVTAASYRSHRGEAMAMGERTNVALISAPASGRMAVGEALTNIAAAAVGEIGNVKLSANWMCACGEPGEDANLFDTVRAVGMELCPALGVCIPVGKDSLSMRTVWNGSNGTPHRQTAPLSLVVSAFAPVADVRRTVTPDLKRAKSRLLLLDLGAGRNRLGGSALAQVFNQVGDRAPDLDDPALFARFFAAVQELVAKRLLLAYHDRSDGGLIVTLAEMAFGGRLGIEASVAGLGPDPMAALFAEELGAIIQVATRHLPRVRETLTRHGLDAIVHDLGAPAEDGALTIRDAEGRALLHETVTALNRAWSELTCRMQALRDNPECANQEFDNLLDGTDPGLSFRLAYDPDTAPTISAARPRMAILREQGINGQVEMAAAFHHAGFEAVDVHMTDLLARRETLDRFVGLVACGGFSYGDVLGAGSGWAKSILFNDELKEMFARFFHRTDSFALGVCNGCQMVSQLKDIIPGAADWPAFTRNKSEQFEARYVTLEILPSPSVLLRGMEGSRIGVPVAHGEGYADFRVTGSADSLAADGLIAAHYVDNHGRPTERYPFNPNGSPGGATAFTTTDGRVTILMPHPERGFRAVQLSYRPAGFCDRENGPWLRLFQNARMFVD